MELHKPGFIFTYFSDGIWCFHKSKGLYKPFYSDGTDIFVWYSAREICRGMGTDCWKHKDALHAADETLIQVNLHHYDDVIMGENGRDGISNHQPHDCLLNRLFRRRSKKTSKLRVTGLCAWNSPGTGEFPAQMASYAENVSN